MTATSRKPAMLLWCVLAAIVIVAVVAWVNHNYVRVERTVKLPRVGEARSNPLFALKLALVRDGVTVNSRRNLQLFPDRDEPAVPLAARDTLVLYTDPRTLQAREVTRLLAWVESGGHLVMRTPAEGFLGRGKLKGAPLLEALKLAPQPDNEHAGCETYLHANSNDDDDAGDGDDDRSGASREAVHEHVMFCGGQRFTLAGANPVHSWGDLRAGYVFARIARGRGSVDVLSDLDFMSSDDLESRADQELTRQILAPNYRAGTIHLVYAVQMPSLWRTLIERSWMAWAPLLLAFAAWLWLRMQRFGPRLPAPADERRSLLEHIVASGEHAYRYGYAHLLYDAVREAFLARLRRRDPQAAALTGAPQMALLQARFPDVPAAQIRDALMAPFANDHASFRSRIATLIRLRNRL